MLKESEHLVDMQREVINGMKRSKLPTGNAETILKRLEEAASAARRRTEREAKVFADGDGGADG